MGEKNLFKNQFKKDHFNLYDGKKIQPQKINKVLELKKSDVAVATKVPTASVRYDKRMPREIKERMIEWALIINRLGDFFEDNDKVILWLNTPHPLFEYITPRDLIRLGRSRNLLRFIDNALDDD